MNERSEIENVRTNEQKDRAGCPNADRLNLK